METEKKKFSFREYYKNNPEFQKRHKAKLAQLVTCTCSKVVQKGYLSKHLKSKAHEKYSKANENNKSMDFELEKLHNKIDELKLLIKQQ